MVVGMGNVKKYYSDCDGMKIYYQSLVGELGGPDELDVLVEYSIVSVFP